MKTVVIIDDEVSLLNGLATVLRFEGYQVVTATTGQDGLKQTKIFNPDLVICDVMLPDSSGLEITQSLKADAQHKVFPLLSSLLIPTLICVSLVFPWAQTTFCPSPLPSRSL